MGSKPVGGGRSDGEPGAEKVLPEVWEGEKEWKKERERPGHSCSNGSPENRLFLLPPWQPKSKREGAVRHIPAGSLSILT